MICRTPRCRLARLKTNAQCLIPLVYAGDRKQVSFLSSCSSSEAPPTKLISTFVDVFFSVVTPEAQDGGNNKLKAKDPIKYMIEVSNTGNTCLREIVLEESAFTCDILTTGEAAFFCFDALPYSLPGIDSNPSHSFRASEGRTCRK